MTLDEFTEYVDSFNFSPLNPHTIVIHHTWRPKKSEWNGEKSILGLKSFYENKKPIPWNAGPHLFIAEDGIWLFTPLNKVGVHAGVGNVKSIGIEVVGDYDVEKWAGKTKQNALGAIKALMVRLKINTESVKFHNDFSTKSCPGHAITKEWLFRELDFYGQNDEVPDWPNVSDGMSAKDVWLAAKSKGYVNGTTKFNDPSTVGKIMIYLARLMPDKFK